GDEKRALATASRLAGEMAPSRRALAKLIEGESLRLHGKPRDAMFAIQDAIKLVDAPLSHLLLARAALDAKLYPDAYSELQTCLARRSEAVLSGDDVTKYRYVPELTYLIAKAQERLGSAESKATYQAFLAMMHDPDADDPIVVDARKHVQ